MPGGAAIILAAGTSTRLGAPKQLVRLGGEQLLARAVRTARSAGCSPVVVVLGAHAQDVAAACGLGPGQFLVNHEWREGMASSLRCGIAALATGVERAVVMTCDQPAVTADHLKRLVELCREAPIASSYAGRRGVPACFPASAFAQLLRLTGDAGARQLLQSAMAIELAGGELDIDTPAALDMARSLYG